MVRAPKKPVATRRSKQHRLPAVVVGVLAENVVKLRDGAYCSLPTVTAKNRALAKAADSTLSQVQRIVARKVAAGVDVVERIAIAFNVRPHDLLTPYFAARLLPPAPDPDPRMPGQAAVHDRPMPTRLPKPSY